MSTIRKRSNRDPWREPEPGFQTYYDIGVIVSKQLPKNMTLEAIGRHFGMTKQNTYTASVLALGKFCYRLRTLRRAVINEGGHE